MSQPRSTRCWVTGAEMRLVQGHFLDRRKALDLRQLLAQRLGLLDHLLAELGPVAGQGERARLLCLPEYAGRLVSPVVAQAYAAALGDAALFIVWEAKIRAERQHWIERVQADGRIAGLFYGLDLDGWTRLHAVARRVRAGLPVPDHRHLMFRHVDACVARLYPGGDTAGVEAWLAAQHPARLVEEACVPAEDREQAVAALVRRCLDARRLLQSRVASEPESMVATPMSMVHSAEEPEEEPRSAEEIELRSALAELPAGVREQALHPAPLVRSVQVAPMASPTIAASTAHPARPSAAVLPPIALGPSGLVDRPEVPVEQDESDREWEEEPATDEHQLLLDELIMDGGAAGEGP